MNNHKVKETIPPKEIKYLEINLGKTTEWERLEISSRKSEISREHFMQRQAQ